MSSPSRVLRIATAGVIAAAMALGLTACGTPAEKTAKTEFTIAINDAPVSMDPSKTGGTQGQVMITQLAYEPLIVERSDGTLGPGLATSWKFTDDTQKTFELKLRQGVKFSDGSALTAKQVIASIERMKTSPSAVFAKKIASGVAVDDSTVQLNLAEPLPVIATLLSQRRFIGSIVGSEGTGKPETLGSATNGAGKYMLDASQTVANDHYTYVPNPHYYDPNAVHFKKLTVRVIANPQTVLSAIKSGQVDFAIGDASTADQAASPEVAVHSAQAGWNAAFLFDRDGSLVPALKDQKVRQALNYAIDRKAIVNALYGKYATPTSQPSVEGYDGFDPSYVDRYPYDPAKAKQLLAEAGYGNGFTLPIGVSPAYNKGDQIAQALDGYWKKIGVTTEIKSYNDISSLLGPWFGKELPAVTGGNDSSPVLGFLQSLEKDGGAFNPFQAEDAELTSLTNTALNETDATKQAAHWQAAMRRVADLGLFVPIAVNSQIYYGASNVKGVTLSSKAPIPDPTQFHY